MIKKIHHITQRKNNLHTLFNKNNLNTHFSKNNQQPFKKIRIINNQKSKLFKKNKNKIKVKYN